MIVKYPAKLVKNQENICLLEQVTEKKCFKHHLGLFSLYIHTFFVSFFFLLFVIKKRYYAENYEKHCRGKNSTESYPNMNRYEPVL